MNSKFISKIIHAFSIPFDNDTNGFSADNVQNAIEEARTGFEGKGFQSTFAGNGTFRDSWLSQEDTNVESNESPDIFKYDAQLVGIDFTNQNQNVDCTIIIAIKEYPFNNVNNPERFYKWTLSGVRSALRTNQSAGFTVNAGDVMAVYLLDQGGNANDVLLTMDFIVLNAPTTEISYSFSQNFSSNDFPALATIPEVLV